jgi:hypothetical protein
MHNVFYWPSLRNPQEKYEEHYPLELPLMK